ncbi:hypothetical protein SGRA_3955 [Saprospira grandis str. Lewin]|uniref:Uncharacterized protein n=1 Tax=Saprospira grandis (strain Lewin) TaxID=984262 RepID=H6L779_SAPGL|nr:hypothetical protein SGRA_3955 [Saprospira grandis str. Lewin]
MANSEGKQLLIRTSRPICIDWQLGPPAFGLRSAARCSLGPAQKTSFCLVCGFAALPTIARPAALRACYMGL